MDRRQRERLLRPTSYERIVARLAAEATLHDHGLKRARRKGSRRFFRVEITLRVDRATVDLFHNGPSGYRAQYYRGVRNGERANADAVERLLPVIRGLLARRAKRTCPWWLVERSLRDASAKVWIHQGRWWRHGRREDRHLLVRRWVTALRSPREKHRRKAGWAGLTPNRETRIDVKGGFLTLEGERSGTLKDNRSRDIRDLGFT